MRIIPRQITQEQFDTLKLRMSIHCPLAKLTFDDGWVWLAAEDVKVLANAEQIALDILCAILEPIRDLPTWSELSRQRAKRLRQSGVQTGA